ncbi:Golgi-associated PDZ and coiled-coil motif-containing protein-like, partial [Lytechinus variegatus]|uniref:Golgi-associated PDZ and coiled-coil motif-containing protein-like n=1 Tax=Lytechinus variegatus TaxID=7654 RepID=UPI001BB0E387
SFHLTPFDRIQQIQLLGRDLRGPEHDKLWNQLEAEIHLHRHKTVIRACRGRRATRRHVPQPEGHEAAINNRGVGDIRTVTLVKEPEEGLGMSITGGKEHGVPILISEIHPNLPADRCQELYVGDAILSVNGINLLDMKHADAVDILSQQDGEIKLKVQFVAPDSDSDDDEDDDDDDEEYEDDEEAFMENGYSRYRSASEETIPNGQDEKLPQQQGAVNKTPQRTPHAGPRQDASTNTSTSSTVATNAPTSDQHQEIVQQDQGSSPGKPPQVSSPPSGTPEENAKDVPLTPLKQPEVSSPSTPTTATTQDGEKEMSSVPEAERVKSSEASPAMSAQSATSAASEGPNTPTSPSNDGSGKSTGTTNSPMMNVGTMAAHAIQTFGGYSEEDGSEHVFSG